MKNPVAWVQMLGLLGALSGFSWLGQVLDGGARAAAQAPTESAESAPANAPADAGPPAPEPVATPAAVPVVPAASAAPSPPPAPVQSVKTTQDAALLTPPPPPGTHIARPDSHKPARSEPPPADEEREEDEGAKDPMNWLGLTVRFGYASVASGTINNPTYNTSLATYAAMLPREALEATGLVGGGACTPIDKKCRTAARNGFQLSVDLHIGGKGIGFDLEPYITIGENAFAAGLYFGPRLELHLVKGLYLGLGLGARAAYVALDGWKNGGDIFGRIPVHFTYYVARNFAFVVEGAFGAGISLFVSEPVNIIDPRTNRPLASAPKIAIGAARGWDITLGLRFP